MVPARKIWAEIDFPKGIYWIPFCKGWASPSSRVCRAKLCSQRLCILFAQILLFQGVNDFVQHKIVPFGHGLGDLNNQLGLDTLHFGAKHISPFWLAPIDLVQGQPRPITFQCSMVTLQFGTGFFQASLCLWLCFSFAAGSCRLLFLTLVKTHCLSQTRLLCHFPFHKGLSHPLWQDSAWPSLHFGVLWALQHAGKTIGIQADITGLDLEFPLFLIPLVLFIFTFLQRLLLLSCGTLFQRFQSHLFQGVLKPGEFQASQGCSTSTVYASPCQPPDMEQEDIDSFSPHVHPHSTIVLCVVHRGLWLQHAQQPISQWWWVDFT